MKNFKILFFAALIAAIAVPLSVMDFATAQETKSEPKMLTKDEVSILAPRYLELEQRQQSLNKATEHSDVEKLELAAIEKEMSEIQERVQEHKEAAKKVNYIPEDIKSKMHEVKRQISTSDLPVTMVGIDTKTKEVFVSLKGDLPLEEYERQIQEIITEDVPIRISYGEYSKPFACANQDDDCDPIVGGLEIEVDNEVCTLSLEVKDGIWPWSATGFLTAGHCFEIDDDVLQPDAGGKIGEVDQLVYDDDEFCDCQFIKKTTSTTSESKIWLSSNTYKTISSKGSATVDDWVMTSLSQTTGIDWEQVAFVDVDVNDINGNTIFDVTMVNQITATTGDSGAPFAELFGEKYHGILNGEASSGGVTYTYYSDWDGIQTELGVH